MEMSVTDIKPSKHRRYPFEYASIALTLSVVYLFIRTENLNTYIRNDLTKQKIEAQATILNNNQAIKDLINTYKK